MDLSIPFIIFGANFLAAIAILILKDLAGHAMRGETRLVLQKLASDANPLGDETPHVEISGRRGGLIGYLLTLLDLSPKVRLTANALEVRKTIGGLEGHLVEAVPLSDHVSVRAEARRSLVWLALALLSLFAGVPWGLLDGNAVADKFLNATAWLAASVVYLFAYYHSHVFQLTVQGSMAIGVSFKPGVIEGHRVRFPELVACADVLLKRIQQSRSLGGPAALSNSTPAETPAVSQIPTTAPPPPSEWEDDKDETLHEPAPIPAEASKGNGTGTIEYGEESQSFDDSPSDWDGGPEPGTSDSIHLRRSITRSESGMFPGVGQVLKQAGAEPGTGDTDHTGATHRGTVSWEEHADKTQDEIRAEAELAELKRSKPRRGEAKLRLKELVRRFPQTEAAKKAHRMLDRLESTP